jgi:hypothetical protein
MNMKVGKNKWTTYKGRKESANTTYTYVYIGSIRHQQDINVKDLFEIDNRVVIIYCAPRKVLLLATSLFQRTEIWKITWKRCTSSKYLICMEPFCWNCSHGREWALIFGNIPKSQPKIVLLSCTWANQVKTSLPRCTHKYCGRHLLCTNESKGNKRAHEFSRIKLNVPLKSNGQ